MIGGLAVWWFVDYTPNVQTTKIQPPSMGKVICYLPGVPSGAAPQTPQEFVSRLAARWLPALAWDEPRPDLEAQAREEDPPARCPKTCASLSLDGRNPFRSA